MTASPAGGCIPSAICWIRWPTRHASIIQNVRFNPSVDSDDSARPNGKDGGRISAIFVDGRRWMFASSAEISSEAGGMVISVDDGAFARPRTSNDGMRC